MLAIVGQTAKPNWMMFFKETLEYPKGKHKLKFVLYKVFFLHILRAMPGTSASSFYAPFLIFIFLTSILFEQIYLIFQF